MEQMSMEKAKLKEILIKYDEYLNDTKMKFKNVYNLNLNKEEAEKKYNILRNKIYTLEKNIDKPYFARIDFKNDNGTKDICYIGKIGISNYDNEIVIVDWRAPISSLYYDSNVGQAEYMVNNNKIKGNLELKRQYEIQNRELLNFFDVDTVSNDELLKPYLGVNANEKTKNIVSTIQKEQNNIIRNKISQNIIVQGVAGSGKTMIALYRIAYLVYNYRDLINNDQYMIITPNKFFSNYISNILPDLDVHDVQQYDLIELTEHFIGEKLKLENDDKSITKYFNNSLSDLPKLKTQLIFKNIIDAYFNNYFKNAIIKSLKIKDFIVIDKKIIAKIWNECLDRKYDNLKMIVDRCSLLLKEYYSKHEEYIIRKLNNYIDEKIENGDSLELCRKERENTKQKLKSNFNSLIKSYFNYMFKNTTQVYQNILKNISKYTNNTNIIVNIDNILRYEDLPSLLYVHYKINGANEHDKYRHVVIDEAQDYNDFTFYAMTKIFPKSSFSIYGDLAQSIYTYRSLESWNSVKQNVFNNNLKIINLNKSYRTTIEIMQEANKINKHLRLPDANAIIRHGDNVQYIKITTIDKIKQCIQKLLDKGNRDIAIISKNLEQSNELYSQLKMNFKIHNITNKNEHFKSGICTIPCHLSKGLEFDGVIVNDASENNFSSESILDMKLLYVAMTRALHSLIVIYKNELSKVLK